MRASGAPPLRRGFASRRERIAYLAERFPAAAAAGGRASATVGGRAEAERLLALLDPTAYGATRNHLDGAVSRLSPYLRHGVVSLAEARDAALARVDRPEEARKFVQELAWRDYFRRVHERIGDGVWHDVEPWKTGHPAESYAEEVPDDVAAAATGIGWVDGFARELLETGYLHNHARMWLAAYLVHWRRVHWRAGARWFLAHLLDGDEASNNLSWQWVASTFGAKPYYFNRANLAKYAGDRFPELEGPAPRGDAFAASYETLRQRLFPRIDDPTAGPNRAPEMPARPDPERADGDAGAPRRAVVWLTADHLGPGNPALLARPEAPAVFVFDEGWIEREGVTLKRLVFMHECLDDLDATVLAGDPAAEVAAFAQAHGADGVVTVACPDARTRARRRTVRAELPVHVLPEPAFLASEPDPSPKDLKRFSRYWRVAEPLAFGGRAVR